MGVAKITLHSYVVRKTQDFSINANFIVLFLIWVMKKCHVNLLNACIASTYLNSQCKDKQVRLFPCV